MRRLIWLILLTPVLAMLLPSCGGEKAEITQLTFDRGNGSSWGDQLYVCVKSDRIVTLRYYSSETEGVEVLEDLPITEAQWQSLVEALDGVELKKEKSGLLEKLFGKSDGGDYRRLAVAHGEKSVVYGLSDNADSLEKAFIDLVAEVTE